MAVLHRRTRLALFVLLVVSGLGNPPSILSPYRRSGPPSAWVYECSLCGWQRGYQRKPRKVPHCKYDGVFMALIEWPGA